MDQNEERLSTTDLRACPLDSAAVNTLLGPHVALIDEFMRRRT